MSELKINIKAMSSNDTKALFDLLSKQTATTKHWKANEVYNFNGDKITLSHDIVWRERNKHKDGHQKQGYRYEVISTTQLGKGAFGTVYDVEGTLALNAGNLVLKQDKSRVVKIQNHSERNPVTLVQQEYALAKCTKKHMSIKQPTMVGNSSYTVMKKQAGEELLNIMNDDLTGKKVLTIKQRRQLSIAILQAYKTQVFDNGLIHRDIKPQNILVDLKDPIKVNFIDFGISTLIASPGSETWGTPGFMAPEIYNSTVATPKADIFSLGRVLGLIWRDKALHYCFADINRAMHFANNVHYNDLFTGLSTLGAQNKSIIKTTLTNMTKKYHATRIDIDEAIKTFEDIQLQNTRSTPPKNPAKNIQAQIDNIYEHLEALRLKNQNLRSRGFKELGKTYSLLADNIETKIKQFQAMKPELRQKNIHTWLNDCQKLIDPVKSEMKNNRDDNYILANLALAIAGLGLLYLIAIACNKAATGNWLFFSTPKSVALADNVENGLQQIAAAAA